MKVEKHQIKEALDAVKEHCFSIQCSECRLYDDMYEECICGFREGFLDIATEQIAEVVTDEQEHRNT